MDEPTTGLHFKDIQKLVASLEALKDGGATVIVIEHNVEFLRSVDHLIDLGPDSAEKGGKVLGAGSVVALKESLKKQKIGVTYQYL